MVSLLKTDKDYNAEFFSCIIFIEKSLSAKISQPVFNMIFKSFIKNIETTAKYDKL